MAIRNNSPVVVIIWPSGKIEVTKVTAPHAFKVAWATGARVELVKVQANLPDSLQPPKE